MKPRVLATFDKLMLRKSNLPYMMASILAVTNNKTTSIELIT
jgi:hypothetical protein